MSPTKRVLAIFIEPTPYILGFLQALENQWEGGLDVIYLKENLSQDWKITLPAASEVLPQSLFKSIYKLHKKLTQEDYSLIHIAGWANLACLYALFLGKIKKIPVAIESDTPLNKNKTIWKKVIKNMCYPMLFKLPSIFLPGGTRQSKYFQHYGVDVNKLVLTNMTIDVDHIQRAILHIKDEERIALRNNLGALPGNIVFLYVGRFLELKGIKELIEAFKALQASHIKLWLVGSGGLENYIRHAAQTDENIRYIGRESGNRLIQIYYAADVFVLPSNAESWGLVVNEAMATENALIVSENVGCVDDLIIHEKTGLLVPAKNIMALTKAMERLIANPLERERLSREAKKHISSWTLANEAKNVIHAWQRVLV